MTFDEYKTAVTKAIEKRIGGKPSFELDDLLLDHGFQAASQRISRPRC